jgi:uncharacterized protein DUF6221
MTGGQDPVTWLRRRIEERMYLARHAIELGSAAEWTELSSGVLMTCAPDDRKRGWDGVHPLGDSSLTRLMEANDPRDTITRCESELGMLDELAAAHARRDAERDDYARWVSGEITGERPTFPGPPPELIPGLERAVCLLAAGYKHRDGYAEHWGQAGIITA